MATLEFSSIRWPYFGCRFEPKNWNLESLKNFRTENLFKLVNKQHSQSIKFWVFSVGYDKSCIRYCLFTDLNTFKKVFRNKNVENYGKHLFRNCFITENNFEHVYFIEHAFLQYLKNVVNMLTLIFVTISGCKYMYFMILC